MEAWVSLIVYSLLGLDSANFFWRCESVRLIFNSDPLHFSNFLNMAALVLLFCSSSAFNGLLDFDVSVFGEFCTYFTIADSF